MQVTVHLKCDAEGFFEQIRLSVLSDIQEARGKKAKASNVHAGYSFKRYLKGKRDPDHAAQVHITAWDPPRRYACTVTTAGGVTTISYDGEPTEDGGVDVTYTEEFEGSSTSQNVLQRAIGAVKQVPARSGVKNQLHALEGRALAAGYDVE